MKIRSTIVLMLWVASLGSPFMSLNAGECDRACCVVTKSTCPMEQQGGKCPCIQADTPFPPIPAGAPIIVQENTVVLAILATVQVTLVEPQPDHLAIRAQPDPPLILPLAAPLLI